MGDCDVAGAQRSLGRDERVLPTGEPGTVSRFRSWFWRPPRAHGEIEAERTVSFLELFYDLVYVVVISQAARQLAGHVSLRGYLEFVVIFGVVWIAWANGTLYYELHGREDGRTRTFVFIQMAILALLAVFTGDAAGTSGRTFAVVYVGFLAVMTWLWYTVRRQDRPGVHGHHRALPGRDGRVARRHGGQRRPARRRPTRRVGAGSWSRGWP